MTIGAIGAMAFGVVIMWGVCKSTDLVYAWGNKKTVLKQKKRTIEGDE